MFAASLSKVLNPEAGWYRGDFHTHTNASDGAYPLSLVASIAKAEGLDFVAITDHNTIDAFAKLDENSNLLIIPGIEVTFDDGDFNVFGIQFWQDWMEDICTGQTRIPIRARNGTIAQLMRRTAAEGLLNSINHPFLHPWEWRDRETDLRFVHCLEIWNDPYYPDNVHANPRAAALWTAWLNAGYRITAIGGSDYHYPPRPEEGKWGERLGLPSTYVYAQELSAPAILEGVWRHRAYVSMGPRFTFEARINGTSYQIGDDLGDLEGEVEFTTTVSHSPAKARAQIIKNGNVVAETLIRGGQVSLGFQAVADLHCSDWYRLDVLNQHGEFLAISNPIFVGALPAPGIHKYGDFADLPGSSQETLRQG